jgi:hypothetical protein
MPEQDVTHFQNTPGKLHFSKELNTLVFTQHLGGPAEESWVCTEEPMTIFLQYNQIHKSFNRLERYTVTRRIGSAGIAIDATIIIGTGEKSHKLTSCIISINSPVWYSI